MKQPRYLPALAAMRFLGVWPALICSACQILPGLEIEDTYVQASSVDLLIVMDNSLSMQGPGQEQEQVVNGFSSLTEELDFSGLDYHIGLTSMDMLEGSKGQLIEVDSYRYITSSMDAELRNSLFTQMVDSLGDGSGWEKGLLAARTALVDKSGEGSVNQGFARSYANLSIIFISDEDDCSDKFNPLPGIAQAECYTLANQLDPVSYYVSQYEQTKPEPGMVKLVSIVGPQGLDNETECGANTSAGVRYIEAVHIVDGINEDICTPNFDAFMPDIASYVGGMRTRFFLSRVPRVSTIEVSVLDEAVSQECCWSYDTRLNAVCFNEEDVPPAGSVVHITYRAASTTLE